MTPDEMIAQIQNKRAKINKEEERTRIYFDNLRSSYAKVILSLAPRMSKMLDVAIALTNNGFPIGKEDGRYCDNITDGIRHHLGFYTKHFCFDPRPNGYYGIENGGCCGDIDLKVEMRTGRIVEGADLTQDLERFVEGFDEREKHFYAYVESVAK